jgi:hypothetical protein
MWRECVCAFEHPEHGLIGPLPFRRVADHTGVYGFAYAAGPGIAAGDRGVRSELDLPATVVQMSEAAPDAGVSRHSLLTDVADAL